jgi:hypothetical protein
MELANKLITNDEEQKTKKDIKVVAIRPGFVAGTNLGRNTNPLLRWLATPLIWFIAKNLDQVWRTFSSKFFPLNHFESYTFFSPKILPVS